MGRTNSRTEASEPPGRWGGDGQRGLGEGRWGQGLGVGGGRGKQAFPSVEEVLVEAVKDDRGYMPLAQAAGPGRGAIDRSDGDSAASGENIM